MLDSIRNIFSIPELRKRVIFTLLLLAVYRIGGQMPLVRRVPKRGFTNVFRTEYTVVNLDSLARIGKKEIGLKDLVDSGLIKKETELVKVLGRGEIASAKTIHAHKFSGSAVRKIEERGGKAVTIG
jgi:large subunit ribosomal protein L15